MPIGSFLRHFSDLHLSNAEGRHFDIKMHWINRLGIMILGIPHLWLRMRIRLVLEIMRRFSRNSRILNAGCGYGILDMELARRGFNNLTLIDIDASRIGEIEHRINEYPLFKERLTAQTGSVTNLPFAENSFEIVISSEVIEHVPDDALMMRELGRVVESGGYVLITTPSNSKSNAKDFHTYGHTKPGYTIEELGSLGKQAGLKLVETRYYLYSLGKQVVIIHNLLHYKILMALFFYPLYLLAIVETSLKFGEPNSIIALFRK